MGEESVGPFEVSFCSQLKRVDAKDHHTMISTEPAREMPAALTIDAFICIFAILAARGHKKTLLTLGSAGREVCLAALPHLYKSINLGEITRTEHGSSSDEKVAAMVDGDALGAGKFRFVHELHVGGPPRYALLEADVKVLESCKRLSKLWILSYGHKLWNEPESTQNERIVRTVSAISGLSELVELKVDVLWDRQMICQLIELPPSIKVLRVCQQVIDGEEEGTEPPEALIPLLPSN
jgi:hypothetical protein